jgi:hypothetical protein
MGSWGNDMTVGIRSLHTFADVERKYANTTPIVSKHHKKEDDVRPLGDRRHKERRIVQLSSRCYALVSSAENLHHTWGMERGTTQWRREPTPSFNTPEDIRRCASVLWTKRADGTEVLRIRNGAWGNQNRLYAFFGAVLPFGVKFKLGHNGKHTISCRQEDETWKHDLWLPHSKVAGSSFLSTYDYQRKNGQVEHDDKRYILLRRRGEGRWEVLHDCGKAPNVLRKKVTKDEKAPYQAAFREFMKWARTMAPLLRPTDDADDAWVQEAKEYSGFKGWGDRTCILKAIPLEDRRAILTREDHPMRVPLLGMFLHEDTKTHSRWGPTPITGVASGVTFGVTFGVTRTSDAIYSPAGRWRRFRNEVNTLMEFLKKEEPKT